MILTGGGAPAAIRLAYDLQGNKDNPKLATLEIKPRQRSPTHSTGTHASFTLLGPQQKIETSQRSSITKERWRLVMMKTNKTNPTTRGGCVVEGESHAYDMLSCWKQFNFRSFDGTSIYELSVSLRCWFGCALCSQTNSKEEACIFSATTLSKRSFCSLVNRFRQSPTLPTRRKRELLIGHP